METCGIEPTVLMAQTSDKGYVPPPLDDVLKAIRTSKPEAVFAPHVETSAGLMLSDEYVRRVGEAVRDVGGIFVLDCIASGCAWVNMADLCIDCVITAPQKGWTGPSCAGLIVLNARARQRVKETTSTSFACNLGQWLAVMEKYESGGHMYYSTLPTDPLASFRDVMMEMKAFGFDKAREAQFTLGERIRWLLQNVGFELVSSPAYASPGVVVCHTKDKEMVSKFIQAGAQIAGGVPLKIGEPSTFSSFRIGLFGLDKLMHVDRTVQSFQRILNDVLSQ